MLDLFFIVDNSHPKLAGIPPKIDWANVRYRSYFENEHHEQWICWEDPIGIHIAGGSRGWSAVTTLLPRDLRQEVRLPLKLTNGERLWISGCFSAIRGKLVFVTEGE